jgi:PAS domain S-box-containing protein
VCFSRQIDYFFFLYGLVFLLLGAVCASVRRREQTPLAWRWLGLFAATHGLNKWLEMLSASLGDDVCFRGSRLAILCLSFACLFEFGRKSWQRLGGRGTSRWIYLPLLGIVALGGLAGMPGMNAAVRYALALTGGLWSAAAMFRASRLQPAGRRSLAVAAAATALYGLAAGCVVPPASFFPASVLNEDTFLAIAGFPVQLLRAPLVCAAAFSAWLHLQAFRAAAIGDRDARTERRYAAGLALTLLLVAAGGWMATQADGQREIAAQRRHQRNMASCPAAVISGDGEKGAAGIEGSLTAGTSLRAVGMARLRTTASTAILCLVIVLAFAYQQRVREFLRAPLGEHGVGDRLLRWGAAAIVVVVGAMLSTNLFSEGRDNAREAFDNAFGQLAADRAEVISSALQLSLRDLDLAAQVRQFHPAMTRDDFARLTRKIVAERRGVRAVVWAPRAAKSFPVLWTQSAGENPLPEGFDLGSEPAWRAALERARDTGQLSATGPTPWQWAGDASGGFLVFAPVYDKALPGHGVEDRRRRLQGFVVGVYGGRGIVESGAQHLVPAGLAYQLEDLSAPPPQRLIYRHAPRVGSIDWGAATALASYRRSWEAAGQKWQAVVAPGTAFLENYQTRCYWWTLVSGAVLTALSALSVNLLMTGRFRAEALVHLRTLELAKERDRLGVTLRSIGDGVIVTDAEGRVTMMNTVAESLTGWKEAEAVGRLEGEVFRIVAEGTIEQRESPVRCALETGRPVELANHTALLARDGTQRAIADSCAPIRTGGRIVGTVLVFRDETQKRNAASALSAERANLDAIFDSSPLGMFVLDEKAEIVRVNAEAASLMAQRPSDLLKRTPGAVLGCSHCTEDPRGCGFAPACRSCSLRKGVEKAIASRVAVRGLEAGMDLVRDGVTRPVWLRLGVQPIDLGGRAHIIVALDDISEHKQAEAELQGYVKALASANRTLEDLAAAAEAATRAKSEFLANMSHEIRTPITAILGYTKLLLAEEGIDRAPAHRVRAFEVIRRNGEYLVDLINDILDLSKIEAGKLQVEPARCSPAQLVADVVALMRVRADEKRLQLDTRFAGPLPQSISTDRTRLRQILVNLVGNALKFTDRGKVSIVVRYFREDDQPWVQFHVTDTGIGMTEEQMGLLFRPFSQVDASASRKFGGTGLGLAISKRLVEALGGRITVRSTAGEGSTFTFTIDPGPCDDEALVDAAAETAECLPPKEVAPVVKKGVLRGRVLVAEDSPDIQRLTVLLLESAGAEVEAVENGQLAVEQAWAAWQSGRPFDVVLMDMQMPIMDGYAAAGELRRREYPLPIIALTAHAMAEDRQKCLDAGCEDYLTKPIDIAQLIAKVAEHVNSSPRKARRIPEPSGR